MKLPFVIAVSAIAIAGFSTAAYNNARKNAPETVTPPEWQQADTAIIERIDKTDSEVVAVKREVERVKADVTGMKNDMSTIVELLQRIDRKIDQQNAQK